MGFSSGKNWEWNHSYNDYRRDTHRYSRNKNQFYRSDQRGNKYDPNLSRYVNPRFRSDNDNQSCYHNKTDDHGNEFNVKKMNDVHVPKIIYI